MKPQKPRLKNHIADRYQNGGYVFCGLNYTKKSYLGAWWGDAIKTIKSNPDYKGIKFCKNCYKIWKKKKIRQLTAEECRKA